MDNKDVKAKPIANIDFILTIIKSLLVAQKVSANSKQKYREQKYREKEQSGKIYMSVSQGETTKGR